MKYIYTICGISVLSAIILPFLGTPDILIFLFAFLFLVLWFSKRKFALKLICLIIIGLTFLRMYMSSSYLLKYKDVDTSEKSAECVVTDKTATGLYRVSVVKISGTKTAFLGAELVSDTDLSPGDKISGDFLIEKTGADRRLNLLSNGIYFKMEEVSAVVEKEHIKLLGFADKIRNYIYNALEKADNGDILYAVTAGDKILITEPLSTDIRRAGLSHVVVVSGMHFSVLCTLLLTLLRFLKLKNSTAAVFLILFTVLFMTVCGFSKSVLRAGITYIIMSISLVLFKKPYPRISLAAALIVTIILNPFSIFSLSYELSFLSTFGILVLSPYICNNVFAAKRFSSFSKTVISSVSVTLSAVFMTLPLLIFTFGGFSTVTVITNLLVSFPVTLILIFTFIYLIVNLLKIGFLSKLLLFIPDRLTDYFKFIVGTFSDMKFSYINVNHQKLLAVVIVISAFAIFLYLKRSERDAELYNRPCRKRGYKE